MRLTLVRVTYTDDSTYGTLSINGEMYCYTCEDVDRKLETGGEKIPGQTAIPRGLYRVRLSMSKRFGYIMPEILDVPQFTGIRFHGGNTHKDTEGCPLLGKKLRANGVYECSEVNKNLIRLMEMAEAIEEEIWLEVK